MKNDKTSTEGSAQIRSLQIINESLINSGEACEIEAAAEN